MMKISNFFCIFLMLFNRMHCSGNSEFIEEFSDVPLFVLEELLCIAPFIEKSFVSFEKELKKCRCHCHSAPIKDLKNFVKKYSKYKKLCLRIKYEVLKIQFCKEEYDQIDRELFNEVSDFYGADFIWYRINLFKMVATVEFELFKKSKYVSCQDVDKCRELVKVLNNIDEKFGKNAESILNEKERELFHDSVFNSNANVFFVDRFVKDCSNIVLDDCKYLDFYYYSIIKFLIDQDDDDLNQDAYELFKQMKNKCSCSEFIQIINSMMVNIREKEEKRIKS